MLRANLSVPLPVDALVSRYLTNKLIGTRPLHADKSLIVDLSIYDVIRYYLPFRIAIPEHGVRYLAITNPFATNYTLDYSIA